MSIGSYRLHMVDALLIARGVTDAVKNLDRSLDADETNAINSLNRARIVAVKNQLDPFMVVCSAVTIALRLWRNKTTTLAEADYLRALDYDLLCQRDGTEPSQIDLVLFAQARTALATEVGIYSECKRVWPGLFKVKMEGWKPEPVVVESDDDVIRDGSGTPSVTVLVLVDADVRTVVGAYTSRVALDRARRLIMPVANRGLALAEETTSLNL